ncbi:Uncharacterised protein [Vibrio cholerae]|nr:Uncharacterised protein [Vibrio cholerae]CSI56292.1 Uncharacterised protein [Vibrio cholerae]
MSLLHRASGHGYHVHFVNPIQLMWCNPHCYFDPNQTYL